MAVYTHLNHTQVSDFLRRYGLNDSFEFQGIAAGIENSNYCIDTAEGRFVLTLFEHHDSATLDYFTALTQQLHNGGIPCPAPLADMQGQNHHTLANRPAWLVPLLSGESVLRPQPAHADAVGSMLARLHLALTDFSPRRDNHYDGAWQRQTLTAIADRLSAQQRSEIEDEMGFQAQQDYHPLPHGTLHSDLFRDNVLFEDTTVTGILDLNDACYGLWLYDLAVAINDWCFVDGELDSDALTAMLHGYQQQRPLTEAEQQLLTASCRLAALRFWLSRLRHQQRLAQHQGAVQTSAKPPAPIREILRFWQGQKACC